MYKVNKKKKKLRWINSLLLHNKTLVMEKKKQQRVVKWLETREAFTKRPGLIETSILPSQTAGLSQHGLNSIFNSNRGFRERENV